MHRFVIAALVVALAQPVSAIEPQPAVAEAEQFAISNVISTVYHEFGHVFIDQWALPILGREEDAADTITTLLLLQAGTAEADTASRDTVAGYFLSFELFGTVEESTDFSDEHGLDVQRAYQMACLLVGGGPDRFGDLAKDAGLDADRVETCTAEHELALRSWNAMAAPYLAGEGAESAAVTVVYEEATADYQEIASLLQTRGVLEGVAEAITAQFVLPRALTIRAHICEEENAYYYADIDEISICYEYAQLYRDMLLDPDTAGMAAAE